MLHNDWTSDKMNIYTHLFQSKQDRDKEVISILDACRFLGLDTL